jgi:hypothetical protein
MVVWCQTDELGCRIVHSVNKTVLKLDPESVTITHPNAKRADGLLVVIKGDHCGEHGRRITHKNLSDGSTLLVVTMVKRSNDAPETLMDPEVDLELPEDHWAQVDETKESKQVGSALVKRRREGLRLRT